jgi:hypothetical protein
MKIAVINEDRDNIPCFKNMRVPRDTQDSFCGVEKGARGWNINCTVQNDVHRGIGWG